MSDDDGTKAEDHGPEQALRRSIARCEAFGIATDILSEESAAILVIAAKARDVVTLEEALTVATDLAKGAISAFAAAASRLALEVESDKLVVDGALCRGPREARH